MSIPIPMECKDSPCRSPMACNGWGYCRMKNFDNGHDWPADDAAKCHAEGLAACRDLWRAGELETLFGQRLPPSP